MQVVTLIFILNLCLNNSYLVHSMQDVTEVKL
jgi:hypothetical protein